MMDGNYAPGDYLLIRDGQAAAQRIAMPDEIEEGVLVEVQHVSGELLVCEKADPEGSIEVKAFPPSASLPTPFRGDVSFSQERSGSRVVEEDDEALAADLSEHLSKGREVESNSRK